MNRHLHLLIVGLTLAFVPVLSAQTLEDRKLSLVASNYPLTYFAERLAGTDAQVNLPVPADIDPPFWQPDAGSVALMQRADLILLNGADYEKWLAHISLPQLRQVNTSATFQNRLIHLENVLTHSHGPAGEHSHGGIAYTTWLDFSLASAQTHAVANALIRKRPEIQSRVQANLGVLLQDLGALDDDMKRTASKLGERPVLASHPVYQYLQRAYGIKLASVHWEPAEYPPETEWAALDETLKHHPAGIMLWEEQPMAETVARMKTKGIETVVFSPQANRPGEGDFLSAMRQNIARLSHYANGS